MDIQTILSNLKIDQLNAMQEASIDAWKEGSDLILLSPTGSGKTLAYLLPLEPHGGADGDAHDLLLRRAVIRDVLRLPSGFEADLQTFHQPGTAPHGLMALRGFDGLKAEALKEGALFGGWARGDHGKGVSEFRVCTAFTCLRIYAGGA